MAFPVVVMRKSALLDGQANGRLDPGIMRTRDAGSGTVLLLHPAARGWAAMHDAARRDGITLGSVGSYRTYARQRELFLERYTTRYLPGRPYKVWQGRRWYQKYGTPVTAVPGTCIEGDAVVLTRRGLVPMREMLVGDEVWTHRYRWRRVTDVRSFEKPVVRVSGNGHPGIDVTEDHRWFVFDGWHRNGARKGIANAGTDLQLRPTNEILNDLLLSPTYVDGVEPPEYATEAWCRWAGAWVADGSIHYSRGELTEGLVYPRNSKSGALIEMAQAAGVRLTENSDRGDGTRRFRFSRDEARRMEADFGRLSKDRRLPTWLLANAAQLGGPFLDGYLSGDGHWTAMPGRIPHWSFSTSSRALAVGVRLLAQGLGWHAHISNRAWAKPSMVKGRRCAPTSETWSLSLYEKRPATGARMWEHEGYIVGKARRIEPRGIATVYDLTVAEDESFCVDGLFTHNSNHGWACAVDVASVTTSRLRWLINNERRFGYSHELQSEPWHVRYWAGDAIPAAVRAYEASLHPGQPDPTPGPSPEPPEDDDVRYIVKGSGSDKWWITDGIVKRYINDTTEAGILAGSGLAKWNNGGPFVWPQAQVDDIRDVATFV